MKTFDKIITIRLFEEELNDIDKIIKEDLEDIYLSRSNFLRIAAMREIRRALRTEARK